MAQNTSSLQYLPALTTTLGVLGNARSIRNEIEAKTDAYVQNVRSMARTMQFKQSQQEAQLQRLNEILGDKMSMTGLQALQREATLKSASAETGGTGTTEQEVIEQAFIVENLQNSALVQDYETQADNIKSQAIADRLGFDEALMAGYDNLTGSFISPLSAGLLGLGSAFKGFNMGMGVLPQNIQEQVFDIKPPKQG